MRLKSHAGVGAAIVVGLTGWTYAAAPVPCACVTPNYGDTTAPTVTITGPAAGASVSGAAVAVSATAADNVSVSGVQFKLDGSTLQSEDTSAPYLISWDTTAAVNGTHSLTAVARDAAGNTTTSSAVSVTVANGGGSTTGTANIWVDTDGGTCTRSGSITSYVDASACSSFQNAYAVAQSGDTVNVKCGDYSAKTSSFVNISYSSAKDTYASNVVFSSADGTQGCVTLPNVNWTISGPHVEFHHFKMDQTVCVDSPTISVPNCPEVIIQTNTTNGTTGAHDVVVDDVQASIPVIAGGVYNISLTHDDFGPAYDSHGLLHCHGSVSPCTSVPHDILIQDTAVHDFYNTTACKNDIPAGCLSSNHQGCAMTVNSGYNIVFNRTRWYNCQDLQFYIHPANGTGIHDVTLENSFIGDSLSGFGPQFYNDPVSGGYWNIRVLNNTFTGTGAIISLLPSTAPQTCGGSGGSEGSGTGGCEFRGNIGVPTGSVGGCGGNGGFSTGWTVEYNASTSVYCGSGTLLGTATGSASACSGAAVCQNNYKTSSYGMAGDNYHLLTSSLLMHILPSGLTWLPTTDIDGQTRAATSSPGDDDVPDSGGGSTAVCSPSPCTLGAFVSHTVSVDDGGGKTVSRTYQVERPNNLVGVAPLLVMFTPFNAAGQHWDTQSVAGKFVVAYIPGVHPSGGQYAFPVLQSDFTYGIQTCGNSGTAFCDDVPEIKAVLDAVDCQGASPCANIDPNKVYAAGASKGGLAAEAAICDTRTSAYFHGAAVLSNYLYSASTANDQTVPPECPAILGSSNGWNSEPVGLAANTNLSVYWAYGDNDGTLCAGFSGDCVETGHTDGKNRWTYSASQLAGASSPPSPGSSAGSLVVIGHRIGCNGVPVSDVTYGATNLLRKRIYTGCTNARRATETVKVHTGGHAELGMDGKDGFDVEADAWAFLVAYGGP